MSHTDKDLPWRVKEARGEIQGDWRNATWREKGSGEKGVRFAKRYASKARRRGVTHPYKIKSLTQTYIYSSS